MVLNVLTPERRLAHSPAGDMALVAGVFVVALTYLDVPFWNALLFGPAITLQAAVGVVVLTRLLKGVPGSLLLLLGPGLILGGALSFTVFQLVGRGTLGLVVVVAVGIGAVTILIYSTTWQSLSMNRMWMLGQILGLAALALTWEFPELLPVAVAFFVLGFFTGKTAKAPRWLARTVGVLASVAIALVPILRQDYWWLITDDYQILEVQMRHWTTSGVLADWGSHEWGRYHWLSGGWAGLLNQLGGNAETFTTLTRVMPLIYCAAFAASLHLVSEAIVDTQIKSVAVNSATWTVVALNRLDWSGTSTGASVPVVVAIVAVLALNRNLVQRLPRRLAIAAIFLPIIALTKFPAIFVALLLFIGNEILIMLRSPKIQIRIQALLGGVIGVLGVALSLVVSIHWVGGFQLTTHNAELGQIADVGPILAMSLVTSLRLWILVIVATILLIASQDHELSSTRSVRGYLASSALFFVTGVAFDVFVDAFNSNGHEYFSAPSYVVSSIAVLVAVSILPIRPTTVVGIIFVALVVILAIVWQHQNIAADIQSGLTSRFHLAQTQYFNLVSYTLSSSTAAVSLLFLLVLVIGWLFKKPISRFLTPLLLSLVVVTIGTLVPEHLHQTQHPRTGAYLESNFGSTEVRDIASFLRMNTPNEDLIGTNSLRGLDGALISDYNLAVWSHRTFLVLGPRFFSHSKSQVRAVALSEAFVNNPSERNASSLWNAEVRWFVVDLRLTDARDWSLWADTVFQTKNFLILKLRSPPL